jgi:hypothetical protein
VLEMLRGMYTGALVEFAWRRGDILVLDNLLAVHGRTPYRGDRRVVVGMARPLSWSAVAVEPAAGAKR